jgi:bacterioferritin B
MLISNKMVAALNEQIGNEFSASLQYVAISSHFASEGLAQLASTFAAQAEEEREHALRFAKFIVEAGGRVEIPAIPAPKHSFSSAAEAVQLSLDQEKTVTSQINQLVNKAIEENDHITQTMLTWFVSEQLEEVSSMDNLLKVIQRAGESNLLYVEEYLARAGKQKKSTPPAVFGE